METRYEIRFVKKRKKESTIESREWINLKSINIAFAWIRSNGKFDMTLILDPRFSPDDFKTL